MLLESPSEWKDYELIDSGDFQKLERFGRYVLIRPEPKALWKPSLSDREWMNMAHTKFTTGAGFGKSGKEDSGTWHTLKKMDEQWLISYNKSELSFRLRLGLTSFKHVGVFPEQAPNWDYIFNATKQLVDKSDGIKPKVLNLFAYTGAASLTARAAGADVTHLDSVKQVVTWSRANMELSSLDNIRWVIEDALSFVKRESKRGNLYKGIIMDPPAYGHGPSGERWKLDEHLFELLTGVAKILAPERSFLVLNLYSNGYSAVLADTLVRSAFLNGKSPDEFSGNMLEYGELFLRDRFGKNLPLSVFVRLNR
ncbi:MAG TPA: class I SAM-dependent methyltransferase [Bacteroidales bacterium]|nr:class I SAM-dependent methyltransferase [Bacteroidales bacterium]HRR49721.1 class I SAM-dependent methyltransferase [Bacteroidales bacterium]HRT33512.1 class I SAM-dependent methyltransferase [Bacteroidales bacterium]HRT83741.1 class I SAM-dependent methyltransferase [Bacteroidales bacterium]